MAALTCTKREEQMREWLDPLGRVEEDGPFPSEPPGGNEKSPLGQEPLCALCDRPLYGGKEVNAPGLTPGRLIHRSCERVVGKQAVSILKTVGGLLLKGGSASPLKVERWLFRRIRYDIRTVLSEQGRESEKPPPAHAIASETLYHLVVARQQQKLLLSAIERTSRYVQERQRSLKRPARVLRTTRSKEKLDGRDVDVEERWHKLVEAVYAKMARRGRIVRIYRKCLKS
jgi:hypothetical protein